MGRCRLGSGKSHGQLHPGGREGLERSILLSHRRVAWCLLFSSLIQSALQQQLDHQQQNRQRCAGLVRCRGMQRALEAPQQVTDCLVLSSIVTAKPMTAHLELHMHTHALKSTACAHVHTCAYMYRKLCVISLRGPALKTWNSFVGCLSIRGATSTSKLGALRRELGEKKNVCAYILSRCLRIKPNISFTN